MFSFSFSPSILKFHLSAPQWSIGCLVVYCLASTYLWFLQFYSCYHQHQCPSGRMSSQELLPPVSVSPGGAPAASWLSGRLSKISRWVSPSSFQITTSVQDIGACEILCAPFKNRVYFPWRSEPPKSEPSWSSKPNLLVAFPPSIRPLGWGTQCGVQTPWSLRRP